jgi:hypothetical protein
VIIIYPSAQNIYFLDQGEVMKKLTWLIIIAFLATACSSTRQTNPVSATTSPVLTGIATSIPAPLPTATNIPTPTATLSFPLSAGTPLPNANKAITTSDLSSLRESLFWWQNPASTTVFSPDHTLVALNTSEWEKIYDTKTQQVVVELKNLGAISGFSPDNQRIMADGAIYTLGGTKIFSISSNGNVSYSDDWKTVAIVKSCQDTGLIFKACESDVYDVDTNKMISGFPGDDPILSPDGKYISVAQGDFLYFRRVSDGKQLLQLNPDNYLMDNPSWSYSADGSKLLLIHPTYSAGRSQKASINIFTLADGKLLATIYVDKAINMAKISSNGLFLATVDDTNLTVYEIKNRKAISSNPLQADKVFTGVDDNGNPIFTPVETNPLGSGTSVQNIQDLRFGTDSNTLDFFTTDQNSNSQQYCTISDNTDVKCSPQNGFLASDGNFYTVTADPQKLTLFKEDNGSQQEISSVDWKGFAPNNISNAHLIGYSAGNDFLVLMFDIGVGSHKALIVDMKKQQIAKQWDWDESSVTYSNLSPDGKYLALKVDGQNYGNAVFPWDEGVFSFEKGWYVWSGGSRETYLMTLSPDSTKMIEMQKGNQVNFLYYYDFIRRELLGNYEMDYCSVDTAAISNDNSFALLGCGGSIEAMDLSNGKIIATLPAFNSAITSIAISKDGSRIAAGSSSGFIKVWDLGN